MVVHVRQGGRDVCLFGVHEEGPTLVDSAFLKTIERLIQPHFSVSH